MISVWTRGVEESGAPMRPRGAEAQATTNQMQTSRKIPSWGIIDRIRNGELSDELKGDICNSQAEILCPIRFLLSFTLNLGL
jgi:hypothetical protein